jgi:ABC-type nitrate/sulfonate/bicarbonate transport system ATPase subunit
MSSNGHPVIRLDGVTKVFFTDEVETHALSGIHLEIGHGEFISIAGPSGCGKSRSSRSSAARLADERRVPLERQSPPRN